MLIFKVVIIGVIAFALGVTLTLFCMRIRDRKKEEDGSED